MIISSLVEKLVLDCVKNYETPVIHLDGTFFTSKRFISEIKGSIDMDWFVNSSTRFWSAVDKYADGKKICINDGFRVEKKFFELDKFIEAINLNGNRTDTNKYTSVSAESIILYFLDLEKMNKYFTKGTISNFNITVLDDDDNCIGFDGGLECAFSDTIGHKAVFPSGYYNWVNRVVDKKLKLPKSLDNEIQFKIWCNVAKNTKITQKYLKELVGWENTYNPCKRLGNYPVECLQFIIDKDYDIINKVYFKKLYSAISDHHWNSDHKIPHLSEISCGEKAMKQMIF